MKKILASVGLSLALALPAVAADLVPWGQAGDWSILTDPDQKNACLVQTTYSDGTILRIGSLKKEEKAYMSSFNPAWVNAKMGKVFPVAFKLDDDLFAGEAKGVKLGDIPGAEIRFESLDFLLDLAKKHTMTIFVDDVQIVELSLDGSLEAIQQGLACQAENM